MFDIFNPLVTKVAKGLSGKTILVYGGNNLGKTYQASKMTKPFYLPFEEGASAINGMPYAPINSWADFIAVNNQFCNPTIRDKVLDKYNTIIFDEVNAASIYCQQYICSKYKADSIGSGNGGYGLWKEYEVEFWNQINRLLKVGFCCYFIAHEKTSEGYSYPKGDTRALAPILDNCDICVHVVSNGVDESGHVIHSTGYLAQTSEAFARSRYDYIDTVIPDFTAENLEKVVSEAIERQEKAEGITAVSFEEQIADRTTVKRNIEEILTDIAEVGGKLADAGLTDDLLLIVSKTCGEGRGAKDLKVGDEEVAEVLLSNLTAFAAEKNVA